MSILDDTMAWIKKAGETGSYANMPIPEHHSVHYTRFLIEDKLGIKLTLEQVKQYMYEEGLLPDEYYFSNWYVDKWMKTSKKFEQNLERQQAYQRDHKSS